MPVMCSQPNKEIREEFSSSRAVPLSLISLSYYFPSFCFVLRISLPFCLSSLPLFLPLSLSLSLLPKEKSSRVDVRPSVNSSLATFQPMSVSQEILFFQFQKQRDLLSRLVSLRWQVMEKRKRQFGRQLYRWLERFLEVSREEKKSISLSFGLSLLHFLPYGLFWGRDLRRSNTILLFLKRKTDQSRCFPYDMILHRSYLC
jgi:hypothetical protein